MESFFPQNWEAEDFFIRTDVVKKKGDKLIVHLTHPTSNEELKLMAIAQYHGFHPSDPSKIGVFFKLATYNPKIEAKIRTFLKIELG